MTNILSKSTLLILFFLLTLLNLTSAQKATLEPSIESVTIDECFQWAKENYPLIKQLDIIDKTTQFSLSNASIGNLPQISINGQATYQSSVTSLPINIPNIEIPTVSKDQYKIYADVYQPLTNFRMVNTNKALLEHKGAIEKQDVDVKLYNIKNRINQIYFGIILIDKKIEQFEIIQSDLDSALVKVEAAIVNGTATLTDKRQLNVERISLDQKIEENKANKLAFLSMLSTLVGKNITQESTLVVPTIKGAPLTINRPEIRLFDLQKQSIHLQQKQLHNTLLPNLGLFVKGGYGRPALNFLSNDFELYYVGGVKFNWNLSGLYNYKNSKESLSLGSEKISLQEETFLLNTNLTQLQQSNETEKYQSLIESDHKIIQLRSDIMKTAEVQLNNGLITTIDYVKYLNDVSKAKQMLLMHQTQLLLSQYNLKITSGN